MKPSDVIGKLLDPSADPLPALEEAQISPKQIKTLAVLRKAESAIDPEGELLTVSYYGAAQGGWIARSYRDDEPANPSWGEETGDLAINDLVRFENVPTEVWSFEIGGYPVLKKWLGYRQASRRNEAPMTVAELGTFREMVLRIAALLALRTDLDAAYAEAARDSFTAGDLGLVLALARRSLAGMAREGQRLVTRRHREGDET